ncbi:MAG: caspase family protein [Pseudomonadota bacterium]
MSRRALVVGINQYDHQPSLTCCVDDANALAQRLATHHDGARNYDCLTLTSDKTRITASLLRQRVGQLLSDLRGGDALLYFSGHGLGTDEGGWLVTQEAQPGGGYPMGELLDAANRSGVNSITVILDCCHSGSMGSTGEDGYANLAEGVTILAASTASQESHEGMANSLFTELLLSALDGGAADVRGQVSAAAAYAYAEQALGAWQQRPMYKSHARHLAPLRRCAPAVEDAELRLLQELFRSPDRPVVMDPSYEHTSEQADPQNVATFNRFKALRNAGLLTTEDGLDLYFVAMQCRHVMLTPLGRFYWRLAKQGRF